MSKKSTGSVRAELDGFVGDRHRSYSRVAYEGESVPVGTTCRNSRQWSGVALEELAKIQQAMELETPLTAETLGANLCFEGLADFSRLPKGTELWFPSGAILVVEGYNPPCQDMSEKIARTHTTLAGESPRRFAFAMAAKRLRGLVGVVEVAGDINTGDDVTIKVYDSQAIAGISTAADINRIRSTSSSTPCNR